MIIETIAAKVASSILSKALTWGLGEIFKSELTDYEIELSKVIQKSIEEYENLYPIEETDKIPFYTSEVLVNEFFRFRFTSKLNEEAIHTAIKEDERIISPSHEQLLKFFEIFDKIIQVSDKLKKLNIESNYKEEIFNISDNLTELKGTVLRSVSEIKTQINTLSLTANIIEEWSKQLDEILENLKQFKPFTAQERLKKLEKRIADAGIEADKKIFSKLYFLQAKCLEQMEVKNISEEEPLLLIKAYKYNNGNEEYKAYAALGYYLLGDKLTASELGEELLLDDKFNLHGWIIRCFLKEDNFKAVLEKVPQIVKAKNLFKLYFFRWLFHHKYIQKISEFESLGLGFDIDTLEMPSINYLNRNYSLVKSQYLLSKYYEQQQIFNSALYLPSAKKDAGYVYANKILKEVLQIIKGSEIEKNHDYYAFQFYCSCLILDENIENVFKMEEVFNRLEDKTTDTVIRMAQAYNLLDDDSATRKAIKILEEFGEEQNEIIIVFNLINYSIVKDQDKVEKQFTKYINFHTVLNRDFVLNVISFIRKGQMVFTQSMLEKLEEIIQSKNFESDILKQIFQTCLYVAFGIGFPSDNVFYKHLCITEKHIDPEDEELIIHLAYGFAHIGKWDKAANFLKDKINFDAPSELYKVYCKILYKVNGYKPELLEHLKKWRTSFPIDYELLELELYFAELRKNWKEVVTIAKAGIEMFPQSEKFICYLFIGMRESMDIQGIRDKSKLVENKIFAEETYGIVISEALLRAGLNEQALELLYKQASDKRNTKSRQSYITLSIKFPPELLIDYEVADIGTFVKYEINNEINIIPITEENKGELVPNILLGKKVGQSFSYKKPVMDVLESGRILRVSNKYLSLFEEIMIDAAKPLSGMEIQVMHFDDNSIESLNKVLTENFGIQGSLEKERVEEEFEKYYSGIISFTDITSSVFRRDFIDAYFTLANKDSKLFRAVSPALSSNMRMSKDTKYILDFTSLCLFFELSKDLNIVFTRKFVISALLKNAVVKKLEEERNSPKTELSLSITMDSVRPTFYHEDFQEKRIEHFQFLLDWINENCDVVDVPERFNLIMGLNEDIKSDFFLQLLIENKLLAEKENHILLTNDFIYYRQFHCSSNIVISPLHFLNKYHEDKNKEIVEFLLYHNYIGIKISSEVLSEELLKWLGGKENRFLICLENMKYNWNPYNSHVSESIKFIKSLYLSSFLNNFTRRQIVATVFSNLLIGLPPRISKLVPQIVNRELRLLPKQQAEVLQVFRRILEMRS